MLWWPGQSRRRTVRWGRNRREQNYRTSVTETRWYICTNILWWSIFVWLLIQEGIKTMPARHRCITQRLAKSCTSWNVETAAGVRDVDEDKNYMIRLLALTDENSEVSGIAITTVCAIFGSLCKHACTVIVTFARCCFHRHWSSACLRMEPMDQIVWSPLFLQPLLWYSEHMHQQTRTSKVVDYEIRVS